MKKIVLLIIAITQLSLSAWAQSFIVRNIQIQGLHRITAATVETYLPIKRGESLRPRKTAEIIRSLYRTGFFDRISLARDGNTLIIRVSERPTIGQLKISGNSVIQTEKLNTVMRSLDVAEGRIYNPAILEKIKQGLLNQYYQLGRYNARVNVNVSPLPRNRVLVRIDISEGLVAKIRRISIIGNHVFPENTLLKQLDITTPGLFTIFTQTDRYSENRLEDSLEKLRGFYLDHGYVHVAVKSSQAEISPDRKSVYITIVIEEGYPYTVQEYFLEGNLIFAKEEYISRMHLRPGEVFSRQKIIDSEKEINKFLGEKGYLFATINLRPRVNEEEHKIILTFDIQPGKRTYVRNITFSDNNRTNDVVLRREMDQMEAAPVSTSKLEESKHRLSLLPYIKNVDMDIKPVPGVDDQIDVNYKVKEDNSAQASVKLGYSEAYGLILGAGLNQKNFLGTGNTLGINLQRSRYEQNYTMEYTDPYYTEDGISRTLSFSIFRVDPGAIKNLNSGYAMDQYDFGVLYSIPVGQEVGAYSRIYAGADYQNILIKLNRHPNNISNQVNSFINRHGRRYQELDFKLGYSRDSRDRAIFPTRGMIHSFFFDGYAPLDHDSLTFYTLSYQAKWYQPLTEQFILLTRGDLGYGNARHGARNFPFFKNFYAGGIDTVRGYQTYTLGPRDSLDQAYGGNFLVDASIGLIFPNYISESLRTVLFVDAGNVYTTYNNRQFGCQTQTGRNGRSMTTCSTNSGPIRFSAGLEVDWMTPFGAIQLSLAKPLNARIPPDEKEPFQFALGANF